MRKQLKKFDCGCEWEIALNDNNEVVGINYEPELAPLNCPKAWALLSTGLTKGVFQLETPLGQTTSKQCHPYGIEELSDIIALVRPGVSEGLLDGKTLKARYIDRKNGIEEPTPMHPKMGDILESTQQIGVYQESYMEVAKRIAGFSGPESYALLKVVAKKLPEKMLQMKTKFIEGCMKHSNMSEEDASKIFEIVEAGQRYAFNKCVAYNTEVQLENGKKTTVEKVNVGNRIKDHKGNFVTVLNKFNNGIKLCIDVTFGCWRKIICTIDHKFLCRDGVKPLWLIILKNDDVLVDGHYCKITDLALAGKYKVMDLEVDSEDRIYMMNDIAGSNSHSVAYALDAYYFSLYPKVHFPRMFFLSELIHAKNIDEIGPIIDDALNFKVEVCKPDLTLKNKDFILSNRCIQYGLGRIRGIGESKITKILDQFKDLDIKGLSWMKLMYGLSAGSSDAAENLIRSGALDFTLLTRTRMLFELSIFNKLTDKQKGLILDFNTLESGITSMLSEPSGKNQPCANSRSKIKLETTLEELKSPPFSLKDTKNKIFDWEYKLLGAAFTTSEVDEEISNCSCEEFLAGKSMKEYKIAASILKIKQIVTKGKQPGQEMAFVEFKDSTQKISGVAFPQVYLEYKNKLFEGNKLLFIGVQGKDRSFLINRVIQI